MRRNEDRFMHLTTTAAVLCCWYTVAKAEQTIAGWRERNKRRWWQQPERTCCRHLPRRNEFDTVDTIIVAVPNCEPLSQTRFQRRPPPLKWACRKGSHRNTDDVTVERRKHIGGLSDHSFHPRALTIQDIVIKASTGRISCFRKQLVHNQNRYHNAFTAFWRNERSNRDETRRRSTATDEGSRIAGKNLDSLLEMFLTDSISFILSQRLCRTNTRSPSKRIDDRRLERCGWVVYKPCFEFRVFEFMRRNGTNCKLCYCIVIARYLVVCFETILKLGVLGLSSSSSAIQCLIVPPMLGFAIECVFRCVIQWNAKYM